MSRTTPAGKKVSLKGGRRWPSPKKKNTDYIVLAPASFLTFGKVNPGPPQTDIFWGGGPPHPSPHFCQRRPPLRHFCFLGEGGREGGQITNLLLPHAASRGTWFHLEPEH